MNSRDRDPCVIRRLTALSDAEAHGLARVLIDCVESGASVGFMHPLSPERAVAFWNRVASDVERGARALLVAEDSMGIVGTVQIVLEQPENQPHRADLSKMLVHRRARRRGIGAALMRAAEDAARHSGKSLLVLDTASGDAERLCAYGLDVGRHHPGLRTLAGRRTLQHQRLLSKARLSRWEPGMSPPLC